MIPLSNDTFSEVNSGVGLPTYDRDNVGKGIVHLGAGAFFKAHQAVYTDTAMSLTGGNWGICAVSLNSTTARKTLGQQDCLYTLKLLTNPAEYRIIGSIKEVLAGPKDRKLAIARIADPNIHIVTMTVTEKGYCLDVDGKLDFSHPGILSDLNSTGTPMTALGLLFAGLSCRSSYETSTMTVISCDNISENGTKLRNAVLAFARHKDAEITDWISENIRFPNTMVDSITPAGDEKLKRCVRDATGLMDSAPVHRELFTDWVIEEFDGPRPAWEKAGAVFTQNVIPYENAKLRLVNAPHSALTYLGLLCGHQTVAQAMADKKLSEYFFHLTEYELIPSLGNNLPIDLLDYRNRIGIRFSNTAVHHELSQIAGDGSAKIPQRFLHPLAINCKEGTSTKCLSLGIAAWMYYVMDTVRNGAKLNDPLNDKICAFAKECSGHAEDDVSGLLALKEVFPQWVSADRQIRSEISHAYECLQIGGAYHALAETAQEYHGSHIFEYTNCLQTKRSSE